MRPAMRFIAYHSLADHPQNPDIERIAYIYAHHGILGIQRSKSDITANVRTE